MSNQEIQPKISEKMNSGMKKGGVIKGFVPETFEDIQRCAALAVNAGRFHVLNEDKTLNEKASLANATLAIMQGMEVGMPVVMAIQLIAVINGRCVIHSEAIPALIWRAGHTLNEWIEGEGDGRVAWCEVTREDNGEIIKRSFSVKDAKTANLWDPNDKNQWGKPNKSTWHCYPERMLQMRARGFAVRDGVPDVLTGLYIREEMDDVVGHDQDEALPAPREEVILPPFEVKPAAPAPAQIEDRTAQNAAEEVALPPIETHDTREAVETEVAKREKLRAQIDADRAAVAERVAMPEPDAPVEPAAEKRGRGRPRKESAPKPEEKHAQKSDDDLTDDELLADATSKISKATDPDELNALADVQDKRFLALQDPNRRSKMRNAFDVAYNAKYDQIESALNG